ncbi:MAG: AsmA-like C-terminal domain-containing protein [Kiloniellales bacterium]
MIQKSTRIALEVAAGILAVVVLVVGMAFWRLSTGPVHLDFLTPRIESALSDPQSGLMVRVGRTELTWGGWAKTIDLHTRDLRVLGREGVTLAALPDVVVRLSLRALVQGAIAPTVIELIGARVNLVRGPDGTFEFGRWRGKAEETLIEEDLSQVLPSVIERLMSKPVAGEPLSFLTAVRIVGGQVSIDDKKLGMFWQAPVADIEVRRDAVGLAGDIALIIALGETRASFTGGFVYDRATNRIGLSTDFTGLHPAALGPLAPKLDRLVRLSTPLDGSLSASLGADGTVDSLSFDVTGDAGDVSIPDLFDESLFVRGVELRGNINGPRRRLEIETATFRLGQPDALGPVITVSGSLTSAGAGFAGDLDIEAKVTARNVSADQLGRWWPEGIVANGRTWVLRNIPHGVVDEVSMEMALHMPDGLARDTQLIRLSGTGRYHDLEVHYLRPLPPITEIAGTATFDHDSINFRSESGHLGALQVQQSTIDMLKMDMPFQDMEIAVSVVGPLREALQVLDHERLALIRGLGIDPATTEGQVAARFELDFPLLNSLALDDIDLRAKANLEQVAVRGFLLDRDVSNGSLTLAVDKSGMEIEGPVELAGVPLNFHWKEAFAESKARPRSIEARIPLLDDAGRKVLGLDLAPYVEGPVSASIFYTLDRAGEGTVKTAVNLQDAKLTIEELSWEKPAGIEGEAYLTLVMRDQRLTEISAIDINAGSLIVQGAGTFDETGSALRSLRLDDLAFGRSRLNKIAVDVDDTGLSVQIGGGVVDATPFFGGEEAETAAGDAAPENTNKTEEQPGADTPKKTPSAGPPPARRSFKPLRLSAPRLTAVYFGPNRFFEAVSLELVRERAGWQRIGFEGRVPPALWSRAVTNGAEARANAKSIQEGAPQGERDETAAQTDKDKKEKPAVVPPKPKARGIKIDFGPKPDGGYRLMVNVQDMGGVLRALDRVDTIHGGRVTIVGESEGPLPLHELKARIKAKDYVMVDAPALAQLLTVASLTGIVDLLNGEGIRFDRLVGKFTLLDGKLETDLIRAYGSALGLTAKGQIDFDDSTVDLRGTAVPAYAVNRILGKIPLLGPILTGGEGEGLLAVTYTMSGSIEDPKVKVNPLSALAPGFLRGLFSVGNGGSNAAPRALPKRVEP